MDAFQATLQEAVDADLLLHVVDASNPNYPEQIAEVQRVLADIGASDIRQIVVFNKLDGLEMARRPLHLEDMFEIDGNQTQRVFVSAKTGDGLPALRRLLADSARTAAVIVGEYSLEGHEAVPDLGTIR